jgi:hypothetical protein
LRGAASRSSPRLDSSAADLGLSEGTVNLIASFQAERQTEGSSFRLSFRAFDTHPSR